ncbi:ABC-type bacteriocin/lantibiotic exporters, contain an N-terminal double-glycine peptidase domain [Serratia fonticola]|uniref:ABC-type bacteriocin/lantibiotic exporters, contain an N-terminal double-glycine peptidase domain n=1 Tax=Serratia fonticola TaxID=47917 RepID=A0A4U9V7A7_SERFO|nr:ABC-type bacteriocin/lantibiotic exporters, contain an N-terminal double-glycine peptidase domain [Serratia fonticola]
MWTGLHRHDGGNAGHQCAIGELAERYPASQHGTSLATLCDIMAELAMPAYPVAFEHGELAEIPLPAILHYGASHYVVLAYRKGNHVCVMNPGIGQQLLPIDALKMEISGYALVLDSETQPDPQALANVQPSKRFSASDTMSLKETARIPGIYRLMILAFLISLTLFIMPTMVSSAINQVFSSAGETDFPYFYFLLAFVVSTTLAFGVRWITERFIKRFVVINSVAGFSRLLSNSLNFFDKRAPGEVFSRFSNWQMASGTKIELDNGLRTDWIIGAIALAVMCYMSPLLAMVSGVGVTLMGLVSVWAIYRDRFLHPAVAGQDRRAERLYPGEYSRVLHHQVRRIGQPAQGDVCQVCSVAVYLSPAAEDVRAGQKQPLSVDRQPGDGVLYVAGAAVAEKRHYHAG